MADNSILKSLTQLENDLRDVNSAKEQIETVSSAYDALQEKVKTFVTATNELSQNVQSLISAISGERANDLKKFEASLESLETASSRLLSSFETRCDNTSSRFGEKATGLIEHAHSEVSAMHSEVAKMELICTAIKESIELMGSLKANTQALLDELKTSQSAQDTMLSDVSAKEESILTLLQDIPTQIQTSYENQKTELAYIKDYLQSVNSSIMKAMQQTQTAILEHLEMSERQTETAIKTNKHLLFLVIILLIGSLIKLFV